MNRLRRARPVLAADGLADDTADVIGGEDDVMVQGLVPRVPVKRSTCGDAFGAP